MQSISPLDAAGLTEQTCRSLEYQRFEQMLRILSAMMKHETNTFSPVKTDLKRFESWGLYRNEQAITAYENTNTPLAAYIDLARQHEAEIILPVAAEAMPSGPVEKDTFERLANWILEPVLAGSIDAVFLDLHGAMVAVHEPDGEGALLKRIRHAAPEMPICVTLDMHANLSEDIISNCDVLIGYKSYPHTDMYDVGLHIGQIMWDKLTGKIYPVMTWARVPVLAQTLRMGTADSPMGDLQELTRVEERDNGILAATVFGGFPMADIAHAGVSVVTVANADSDGTKASCARLARACWQKRKDLIYDHSPVDKVLETARCFNKVPVILLDHADNVGSGGTADVMGIIKAVLQAGMEDVAMAALYDPQAVEAMHKAGEGAELTLDLGGKINMPSLSLPGQPLRLTGIVRACRQGRWVVRGPMYTGITVDTGLTAVFETGGMKIVVTSVHHEPWDAGILSENGIDPLKCRYILLKSRIHYRAGFQPIQPDLCAHFTLDGTGVTTSDNTILIYNNLQHPIYPLDSVKSLFPETF